VKGGDYTCTGEVTPPMRGRNYCLSVNQYKVLKASLESEEVRTDNDLYRILNGIRGENSRRVRKKFFLGEG